MPRMPRHQNQSLRKLATKNTKLQNKGTQPDTKLENSKSQGHPGQADSPLSLSYHTCPKEFLHTVSKLTCNFADGRCRPHGLRELSTPQFEITESDATPPPKHSACTSVLATSWANAFRTVDSSANLVLDLADQQSKKTRTKQIMVSNWLRLLSKKA